MRKVGTFLILLILLVGCNSPSKQPTVEPSNPIEEQPIEIPEEVYTTKEFLKTKELYKMEGYEYNSITEYSYDEKYRISKVLYKTDSNVDRVSVYSYFDNSSDYEIKEYSGNEDVWLETCHYYVNSKGLELGFDITRQNGNSQKITNKIRYYYDSLDRLINYTIEYLDSKTQEYFLADSYSYIYLNNTKNILVEEFQSKFNISDSFIYAYNQYSYKDGLLECVTKYYGEEENCYSLDEEEQYYYENNLLTTIVTYEYKNGIKVLEDCVNYEYDENGKCICEIKRNQSDDGLIFYRKNEYQYDSDGNLIIEKEYFYNFELKQFEIDCTTSYEYLTIEY